MRILNRLRFLSGLVYSLDISSSCINVMTYARLSVLQCRSFIADILVVTAVLAKRLGLCVNQADVHDLRSCTDMRAAPHSRVPLHPVELQMCIRNGEMASFMWKLLIYCGKIYMFSV